MPRWWCLVWSPRVPEPWPSGAWHCPACGRTLVGEGRPGRSAWLRWQAMSVEEQVRDCLVDGTQLPEDQRRPLDAGEIRARALVLAASLGRLWAKRLRGATSMYDLGHYLWWLRRDRCTVTDTAEVDRLLYAIGLLLPPGEPRPKKRPLVVAP